MGIFQIKVFFYYSQKPIATSNFVIHSLHCQRNLTKCSKCGEAVPRTSLDEHDLEFHSSINCPDCNVSVEKLQLDAHKKTSCRFRQKHCPFCELELPVTESFEHENYCGSRTKICEECGEYVMLKYEQLHVESNHTFLKLDDEPGPTATWIKNDLESGTSRPAKSNNNKKPQLNTGKFDFSGEDDVDDIRNKFAHLMKKSKAPTTIYPGVAYPVSEKIFARPARSPPPYQDVEDDSSDLIALPCEFCDAMIPVNQLILHQTGCKIDVATWDSKVPNTKKNQIDSPKQCNDPIVNGGDSEWNGDELAKDWTRNSRSGPFEIRRNAIDEGNIDIRRNDISGGNEASLRLDLDDEGIYLPCEFCGDGYPPSLLIQHQGVCDYNGSKNFPEASPSWPETQEATVGRSKGLSEALRSKKFDESNYNTFVQSTMQQFNNGARGKNNLDYVFEPRGNFTVASEWSDDSDSRPTSSTGAIPKQKAGKLNVSRKVNQEVQSTRPSNSVMQNHSRNSHERPMTAATSDHNQQFQIRNNLNDEDDE